MLLQVRGRKITDEGGKREVSEGTDLANDSSRCRLLAILEMTDTNTPKSVCKSKDLESLCCNSSNLIVYSLLFWSVEERLEVFWNKKGVLLLT